MVRQPIPRERGQNPTPSTAVAPGRIRAGRPAQSAVPRFTLEGIMQLQQTVGNRFVSRMLGQQMGAQTMSGPRHIQRAIEIKGKGDAPPDRLEPDNLVSRFIGQSEVAKTLKELKSDEDRERILREALHRLDNMSFDSMKALQKQVIREVKQGVSTASSTSDGQTVSAPSGPSRGEVIGRSKQAYAQAVELFFASQNKDAIYYKLGLVDELGTTESELAGLSARLAALMEMVAQRINEGAIGRVGVEKTLSTLLSPWSSQPKSYMDDYRDNKNKSMLGGELVTLRGLIGELNALYYASQDKLDDGEKVFSGANFKDESAGVEEDVDVSYIDSTGVLHLVECAADANVLKNKLRGSNLKDKPPEGQKQRYQHLAGRASSLTQETPDLGEDLSVGRDISSVVFEYSIPPEEFAKLLKQRELAEEIARNLVGDMRLRVGTETYTREQLQKRVNDE